MYTQLLSLFALLGAVPTLAVPGAAWVRRQEDAQSSLTLDPAVVSHGLEQDGQGDNPDPGQVRSLTSSNNFINFCLPFLDQGVVLTNGAQVTAGSCNQVPMGRIISLDLAPRCKFVFPKNGDESLVESQPFTVKMKILNMQTGNFVNAQTNYYAAPQQVNDQGIVIGHSHIVIEAIPDLQTTEPLDPNKFSFFKGLNGVADGDNILSTDVSAGLPAGVYRMCSINTAANHQPALVSNAQHGSLDDCSYFTVKAAGSVADVTTTESATASATDANTAATSTATATVADAASSGAQTTDAQTTDAQTTGAQTTDAQTTDAQTTDAQTTDAQTTDAQTTDAQTTDAQTTDAQTTDAQTTDAATATATGADAPAATDFATVGNGNNGSNDGQATSTDAAAATTTDVSAPAATESAAAPDNSNAGGNGNNNNNGGNQGKNNDNNNNAGGNGDNNGGNGGNNDNNSGNNDNNGNNNNGGNGGNQSDSAPAPAATESSDPAPADNADASPSQEAPSETASAAPEATAAPGNDNNNNNNNGGGNDNQGGNNGGNDAATSTV